MSVNSQVRWLATPIVVSLDGSGERQTIEHKDHTHNKLHERAYNAYSSIIQMRVQFNHTNEGGWILKDRFDSVRCGMDRMVEEEIKKSGRYCATMVRSERECLLLSAIHVTKLSSIEI